MHRRRVLELATITGSLIAGCTGNPDQDTASSTPTDTPPQNPDTIYVDSIDGSEQGTGTNDDPIQSIQIALSRAEPGTTVRVAPGEYVEQIVPPQGGTPGAPITLTGPPEAVLKSDPVKYNVVLIRQSHIHITGLTIDGLENPDAPEEVASYSEAQLVQTRPPVDTDEYLEDIVIAPHRIGNTQKSLVSLERTRNAEVGPFRVIGPSGADYTVGNASDHNGELVYLGTAPANLGTDWHPWEEFDQTSHVHVHHIDASAGHPHGELVDLKPGTNNCTVEYCTSTGGGLTTDGAAPTVVGHNGHHNVVRWNEIADCAIPIRFDGDYSDSIFANDIYGNYFYDFSDDAVAFEDKDEVGIAQQRHICGNNVEGDSIDTMTADCSTDVPESDGVGHLGGDSPWR
ncbi:hypothetical protein [Halorubrum trueperi]|uniref:DUF1565 domain-containing protein n=1 Tax=Halorubrum trueperi TaxID=2004704 RepID=A0ABD5URA3_9EURY